MSFDHVRRPPRIVGVITAHVGSGHCPDLALLPLGGRPLLHVLLERVAMLPELDSTALATSSRPENRPLIEIARTLGIPAFPGEEVDLLRRVIDCARNMDADHVVWVCGDQPLVDLETMARLVERHLESGADFTYVPGDARHMGILCEVASRVGLERSWTRGVESRYRAERATLYIKEHPSEFKVKPVKLPEGLYRDQIRLNIQEPEDVKVVQALFERLAVPGKILTTRDALELLDREPDLARINVHLRQRAAEEAGTDLDRKIAML